MFKFSGYEYNPDNKEKPKDEEEKPRTPKTPRMEKLLSICELRPHLYICGYGALAEQKLKELGVKYAIDVTNLPKPVIYKEIEYLYVRVDDSEVYPIRKFFQSSADFIKKAKDSGSKCIVYCAAGVSRAATICMMYLVIYENLSLKEAYEEVVRVRPIIAPNLGFWRQMIDFESEKTGGKPTVELLKGMSRPIPSVYLYKSKIVGSP